MKNQSLCGGLCSIVRDVPFVHFYLACGHLITMTDDELQGKEWPSAIECWACEGETNQIKEYLM